MPYAQDAFSTLGATRVLEGRNIGAADVRDAELLALRSTTKVNAALLDGSKVRFVGTATIGTDHLDIPYLEQHGIKWCYSPGCNANSVSEYLTAALLTLSQRHGFSLSGKTLGVIGVGNVGSKVVAKGRALGMRILQNDPPREQEWNPSDGSNPFVSLQALLEESDVVTMHVPMNKSGAYPTFHLADEAFFRSMRKGAVFINAARGAVVDTKALISAIKKDKISHAVIDTWEGEPDYRTDLMRYVDIATPHIAGHSFEGRVNGTVMVYLQACRFLGVNDDWSPDSVLPEPDVPLVICDAAGRRIESVLHEIVNRVYKIDADDARFRATADAEPAERILAFDKLRREYPVRREFRFTQVRLNGADAELTNAVQALGFS